MPAPAKRDYYSVLGVDRDAAGEDIKKAYRKLAIRFHPDRNPDNPKAEDSFKEATEAYAVLSDPEKRRKYDRLGHAAFAGDGAGFDMIDLSAVGEILEGLLGDVLGTRQARGRSGRDLNYELEVSFEEAARGAQKTIEIERNGICSSCRGSGAAPGVDPTPCRACSGCGTVRYQRGFFASARTCQTCHGTGNRVETPCPQCDAEGVVPQKESLVVKIPPGVEDGSVRTVRGGGERTASGTGDLHVQIRVKPHLLFTRDGTDIKCTVPVTFPQAVLGTELDVPTLEGQVKMKLPPGTQSGRVFRLRGKGIAALGAGGLGDQLVTVVVEVPAQVSENQRSLIEELAVELGTDAHPQQKGFLSKLRSLFE